MPLISTRGAASAQGFGEFASAAAPIYIEDVFSTYLYTGTGATQTITNGIDLTGKGGLVWLKKRSSATGGSHRLMDTVRGGNKLLSSNTTGAESTSNQVTFLSSGFNVIDAVDNAATYVSWTFREQAKFFDIVTYTGNNSSQTINHNLGSVPGCIIVKCVGGTDSWFVYHRSLGASQYLNLNLTDAANSSSGFWGSVTSTSFGTTAALNANGLQYVAYLFAHDAGGFGAAGTDNVISCGSYSGSANVQEITLGYEPQWLLVKCTSASTNSDWLVVDVMRGMTVGSVVGTYIAPWLLPNSTSAEQTTESLAGPTPTGFILRGGELRFNASGRNYIYIAIRRGPMKTPTSGTSVFSPKATQGPSSGSTTSSNPNYDAGFPVDLFLRGYKPGGISVYTQAFDRLRGINGGYLTTSSTASETGDNWAFDSQIGVYNTNAGSNSNNCAWLFRRAPGFFDTVCYEGNSVAGRNIPHNLAAVPELMIVKRRDTTTNWAVYSATLGNNSYIILNSTGAEQPGSPTFWNNTTPTASVFTVGISINQGGGGTFVAYLFATCPGVSKVGSYTGTGALQTINCGFAAGARFVLIKRTDSTGDWWVYDSARGITSGNDPYLFLNSTAAEVTSTNYVDTASTGFQVTAAAPAGLNAVGGTYIFLAIA